MSAYYEPAGLEVVHDDVHKVVVPRREGLEVVHDSPALEVSPLHDNTPPYVIHRQEPLQTVHDPRNEEISPGHTSPGNAAALPGQDGSPGTQSAREEDAAPLTNDSSVPPEVPEKAQQPPLWKRKRWFILGAVLALIVILAAVLGGVLGSRSSGGSDDSSPSDGAGESGSQDQTSSTPPPTSTSETTSSPSSEPTSGPSSIAAGSRLSATAHQDGDEYGIRVIFSDPDGGVRLSSLTGVEGDDETWANPERIQPMYDFYEGVGSGLCVLVDSDARVTYYLYYVNGTSVVNNLHLNQDLVGWQNGNIGNDINRTVISDTGVAAFGPWLVVWSEERPVHIIRLPTGSGRNEGSDIVNEGARWQAREGTKMAIVPLRTNLSREDGDMQLGIFLQSTDGRLVPTTYMENWVLPEFQEDNPDENSESSGTNRLSRRDHIESWPTDDELNIRMPDGASFSAFTVARSNDSSLVNTHILYKDENNDIQHVWFDGGDGWQEASPEALQDIDEDSDIACITMNAAQESDEPWSHAVFMRADTHLSRCYYQRRGYLWEAQLQGDDWIELGQVRMP